MFLDVLDGLPDGLDLLGLFVGDGDIELLLELHDELDGVERVGSEVVDEGGSRVTWSLATPICSLTISITRSSTDTGKPPTTALGETEIQPDS